MIIRPAINTMSHLFTCEKLYHYTKFKTLKEKILPNGTLLLNKFSNSYDPLENHRLCVKTNYSEEYGMEHDYDEETDNWFSNNYRFICFSKELVQDDQEPFPAKGHLLPRMWAQYGDFNHGVCLVFDKNKLLEKVRTKFPESFVGNISYTLDKPDYSDMERLNGYDFKKENILKNTKLQELIFLSKFSDYRDEQEWRIVIYNEDPNDSFVSFGDSLLAIVFGSSLGKNRIENTYLKVSKNIYEKYQTLKHYQVRYGYPIYYINDDDSISLTSNSCSCFDITLEPKFKLPK